MSVPKRTKFCAKIPAGVKQEDFMEGYKQGWGHGFGSVIHWLRNHYKEYFDPTDEALLKNYMDSKHPRVHLSRGKAK